MSETKPPVTLDLTWDGDLRFIGRSGGQTQTVDSDAKAGPSPMQLVAFGLAGCMAVDVVHILKKGRHELTGLRAALRAERASSEPRRFVAVDLRITVEGPVAAAHVERAVALSHDKYCSVWHSLKPDIAFTWTAEVVPMGVTSPGQGATPRDGG